MGTISHWPGKLLQLLQVTWQSVNQIPLKKSINHRRFHLIEWSLGTPIQSEGKPSLHNEAFFSSGDIINYLDSYLVILGASLKLKKPQTFNTRNFSITKLIPKALLMFQFADCVYSCKA